MVFLKCKTGLLLRTTASHMGCKGLQYCNLCKHKHITTVLRLVTRHIIVREFKMHSSMNILCFMSHQREVLRGTNNTDRYCIGRVGSLITRVQKGLVREENIGKQTRPSAV